MHVRGEHVDPRLLPPTHVQVQDEVGRPEGSSKPLSQSPHAKTGLESRKKHKIAYRVGEHLGGGDI